MYKIKLGNIKTYGNAFQQKLNQMNSLSGVDNKMFDEANLDELNNYKKNIYLNLKWKQGMEISIL